MSKLGPILHEIENKTKIMIDLQKKAYQDPNEGPYPTMLKLITALRLALYYVEGDATYEALVEQICNKLEEK